jgi:hypothetical protein
MDYEVGKEIFVVERNSRSGQPFHAVITKVGRKYAYAQGVSHQLTKIDILTNRTVVTIGTNAEIYESEQVYIEAQKAKELQKKIAKKLTGAKQQSLEVLSKMADLLGIDV